MDHIDLMNGKFWIETINRKDREITVSYHEKVNKDVKLIQHLKIVMAQSYKLNMSLDLPVFFKKGTNYSLISRYWILSFILDNKIDSFPAIVFEDQSMIPNVLAHESIYVTLFNKRATPVPYKQVPTTMAKESSDSIPDSASPMTRRRYQLREWGIVCPDPGCRGVLLKSTEKVKTKFAHKIKNKDMHLITCFYKNSSKNPCPFHALLTTFEFKDFKKGKLPTNAWISVLPEEKCPRCKTGFIFRRTIRDGINPEKIIDRCSKYYFELKPSCSWLRIVSEKES